MKRKPDPYPDVYPHYSYFHYDKCVTCELEFRKEGGWRRLCGPYVNGMGRWLYACKDCHSTKAKAAEVLTGRPKGPRPMPPSIPPRKK